MKILKAQIQVILLVNDHMDGAGNDMFDLATGNKNSFGMVRYSSPAVVLVAVVASMVPSIVEKKNGEYLKECDLSSFQKCVKINLICY